MHPTGDVVAFDAMTSGITDAPLAAPTVEAVAADPIDEPGRSFAAHRHRPDRRGVHGRSWPATHRRLRGADARIGAGAHSTGRPTRNLRRRRPRPRALRQMVVRSSAISARSDAQAPKAIAPLMEFLFAIRGAPATTKDFATSDAIRDRLAGSTSRSAIRPPGATWHRRDLLEHRSEAIRGWEARKRSGPPLGRTPGHRRIPVLTMFTTI